MTENLTDIPAAWENIDISRLTGIIMIVGASDSGKSTFCRYLFQRLCKNGSRAAYLDGDAGQSTLGPPATITLAMNESGEPVFPPKDRQWRYFIGAVSPVRHMIRILAGVARLTETARKSGAKTIVYDTCGFIDSDGGGMALKLAKIDLLRPRVVIAIQRHHELDNLIIPLKRSRRTYVIPLSSSSAVRQRGTERRQAYRAEKFARYFASAGMLKVTWTRFAVFPAPRFNLHQLVAMEDRAGFVRGLGIVMQNERDTRQLTIHTPLTTLYNRIDTIRVGDILVNPETFRDSPLISGVRKHPGAMSDQQHPKIAPDI